MKSTKKLVLASSGVAALTLTVGLGAWSYFLKPDVVFVRSGEVTAVINNGISRLPSTTHASYGGLVTLLGNGCLGVLRTDEEPAFIIWEEGTDLLGDDSGREYVRAPDGFQVRAGEYVQYGLYPVDEFSDSEVRAECGNYGVVAILGAYSSEDLPDDELLE